MIQSYQAENNCGNEHRDSPRVGNITRAALDNTCQPYQYTLAKDRSQTIEGRTDTNELSLITGRKSQHIETVSRDIVRCRCKRSNNEQQQGYGEHTDRSLTRSDHLNIGTRNSQRQQNECQRHQDLHTDSPPTLGLENIYEGAPKRFERPRQIEQRGEQCHLAIGYTHLGKHHYRDVVHDEVRNTLRKIERRNPSHRATPKFLCFVHFSKLSFLID